MPDPKADEDLDRKAEAAPRSIRVEGQQLSDAVGDYVREMYYPEAYEIDCVVSLCTRAGRFGANVEVLAVRATEEAAGNELSADCKHGNPLCGECAEEAPLELLRLNPHANHGLDNKPPTDPLGRFVFGIRYYAGMLEDDDNWAHALGHIQECCKEFAAAIAARSGLPPPEEDWEAAFKRVYKTLEVTDRERMAFSCGWAVKAEQAPPVDKPLPWDEGGRDAYFSKLPGDARLVAGLEPLQPSTAELIATIRRHIPTIALTPPAFEALECLTELEKRIGGERG